MHADQLKKAHKKSESERQIQNPQRPRQWKFI